MKNKPYFTKYLPEKGEIKEHSVVFKDDELATVVHIYPNGKTYELEFPYGTASYPSSRIKLAKLFLCSRDAEPGDTIYHDKYYPYPTGLHLLKDEKMKDSTESYKVVGEISKDAIWVKEGMEFDGTEISLLQNQYVPVGWHGDDNPEIVYIKCSQCNTFH